jgi:pimeloyl-ACP methyl ester carboxylesterase
MSTDLVRQETLRVGTLAFDADVAGAPGAPLVLLLHGFPQTSHTYRDQLPALARAGYLAVAPNQRGYSAGARPLGIDAYASELLVADALGMADALGAARFHLVGHDWGGQLAWLLAAQQPARIRSLTVLSRPHPAAFAAALRDDPEQASRSKHHGKFQDPSTARRLLEDGAARLRKGLLAQGVAPEDVDAYLSRLADEPALDAALNWYRATTRPDSALARERVPAVAVPTLYLWGDADATVGRAAAEGTARFVRADYRFEIIPGAGHFLTDAASDRVTEALLAHLARHG